MIEFSLELHISEGTCTQHLFPFEKPKLLNVLFVTRPTK